MHQGRDGGDQAGLWCGPDVMQGIHPAGDQTDMRRAPLVWQGFPSREQGEGSRRKADEIMEKVQVIKEAFRRLVRTRDDQPRTIPQFAQLRMPERGEGEPGGGAVDTSDRGTARVAYQSRGDRSKPLGAEGVWIVSDTAYAVVERMRWIRDVVETPGTKGMVRTTPPCASTISRPTIRSTAQSPPLTRTSGCNAAIRL